jgi:hypothetical protein
MMVPLPQHGGEWRHPELPCNRNAYGATVTLSYEKTMSLEIL